MTGQDIIDFIKKKGLLNFNFSGNNEVPQPQPQNIEVPPSYSMDKEELFQRNLGALHEQYKSGKLKLSNDEMDLLTFCHNTDMRKFLSEEFKRNPTPEFE